MKARKSLLILILGFLQIPMINAQVVGLCPDVVPYSDASQNCIFLSKQSAEQIKTYYQNSPEYKPESVVSVSEKQSKGYRLHYRHEGRLGWQKYWIKVMTINTDECLAYYKDYETDILMLPFSGLKSLVGSYGHTAADFKKVYKQYQHLSCRLYRQTKDIKGVPTDDLSQLLKKYNDNIGATSDNLMASGGTDVSNPVMHSKPTVDNWDYWLQFLKELDEVGYVTLIEYSTSPD